MNIENLENKFSYHPPKHESVAFTHQAVRDSCLQLALLLNDFVPDGDEKEIAINKLREVMMWANAGIACNPKTNKSPLLSDADKVKIKQGIIEEAFGESKLPNSCQCEILPVPHTHSVVDNMSKTDKDMELHQFKSNPKTNGNTCICGAGWDTEIHN